MNDVMFVILVSLRATFIGGTNGVCLAQFIIGDAVITVRESGTLIAVLTQSTVANSGPVRLAAVDCRCHGQSVARVVR